MFANSSRRIGTSLLQSSSRRGFATTPVASRSAIVTGSSRGIGKAIALRLARDGYAVCINDLPSQQADCESVVAEIKKQGGKACVGIADTSVESQVKDMVQLCVRELGPLTTMVANAGIGHVKAVAETPEDEFDRLYRINLLGVQNCFSAATRQMLAQGNCKPGQPGKLLAASSALGFKPQALMGPYCATKFAVRGLVQSYALEHAKLNITANSYAPGVIDTHTWRQIDVDLSRGIDGTVKTTDQVQVPGWAGKPEDIAGVVSFLSSPDSNHVTGQTLIVDGGMSLGVQP